MKLSQLPINATPSSQDYVIMSPKGASNDYLASGLNVGNILGPMKNLKAPIYGAVGDGITDDTAAVQAWISDLVSNGGTGYAPGGTYKCTQRLLWGMPGGNNAKTFTVIGDGMNKTFFNLSSAPTGTGPQFHIYVASGGPTASCPFFKGFTVQSDTPNVVAAIGLQNISDNIGNAHFEDISFNNSNSTNSSTAICLQVNWAFASTFINVDAVGKVGYGVALDLAFSQYNTFIGGSYSNASKGIRISSANGGCVGNVFITPDIENVNYGISCENAGAGGNRFIGGYYDIWRPDLGSAGTYAVTSSACGTPGLLVDNPWITSRSPTPAVDPSNFANVAYSTSQGIGVITSTPASASAAGVKGQITWSNDYIFVCVGPNQWKRTSISSW